MLHDLILLFGGLIVGMMNAIAGGGNLIGFPLMLAVGMSPLVANATSNLSVLPGNIGASFSYRRYLKRVPKQYLLMLVPGAIGAAIGAFILRRTSFSDFNSFVPYLIVFAVALFAFQPFLYKLLQTHLNAKKKSKHSKNILIISLALIPLSIYGGYFGAGFGFIMLAFLGFTKLHDHIHRTNALKCCMTVCISLVSLIVLANSHLINWHYGEIMAVGNLFGGLAGAKLTQKVSSHNLRVVVIIIGVCTAGYLLVRSY
jgi:uncharacterized membrane protein YfcA